MSGAVGIQGRNATSFGYGPRLGVGRYPARGEAGNALLTEALAASAGRLNPGTISFPTNDPLPPELMAPAPQAPLAAGGGGGGDSGGENMLLSLLPLLGIGGAYLARQLLKNDTTPGAAPNGDWSEFGSDIQSNFGLEPVGNLAADAVLPMAAMDPAVTSGIFNAYGYNATPAPGAAGAAGLSVSDVAFQNTSTGGFPGMGDWADGADGVFNLNAASDAGGAGAAGSSWNPMDWSVGAPGTGSLGLDVSVGPMTFNPVNMAAGAAGSYAGGRLAEHLAPYSGMGQTVGSSLGGMAGGALLGAAAGPIGALAGAFLGSLGGGTIGADSPNYPYAYFGGTVGNGTIDFWNPAAQNGGDASSMQPLTNALRDYVTGRMGAEGFTVNPYMGGQRAFSAGTTADPGGKFFVGAADINPATAAYGMDGLGGGLFRMIGPEFGMNPSQALGVWRGDNVADLPEQVWQQLLGSGAIGAPGSFQAPAPPQPQWWEMAPETAAPGAEWNPNAMQGFEDSSNYYGNAG